MDHNGSPHWACHMADATAQYLRPSFHQLRHMTREQSGKVANTITEDVLVHVLPAVVGATMAHPCDNGECTEVQGCAEHRAVAMTIATLIELAWEVAHVEQVRP